MRHLRIGRVEQYLLSKLEAGEKIHLLLIDPEESSPENASMIAFRAEAGSDGIMVGGSTFFS